ncbi:winged helix-turn-helix transcriptional regulator [Pleionea mediterranea]|uniref:winged helix-turn-helix transcriptional regulator n=1 Tax=Pleionea mediterranea TaxID=523701 RepID=UPI002477FB08|nr:winged helix-turn-helix transcriptional regulator [Pleionea mediterranea]
MANSDTIRFNELRRLMPGVTQRMLTKQLRELEADQLIVRKVYPEVPPRMEYSMADYGLTLAPIITALQKWGTEHLRKVKQEV